MRCDMYRGSYSSHHSMVHADTISWATPSHDRVYCPDHELQAVGRGNYDHERRNPKACRSDSVIHGCSPSQPKAMKGRYESDINAALLVPSSPRMRIRMRTRKRTKRMRRLPSIILHGLASRSWSTCSGMVTLSSPTSRYREYRPAAEGHGVNGKNFPRRQI